MKSQHITLLTTVANALTNLATQGVGLGIVVNQVSTTFPDGRRVIFAQDDSTGGVDWFIISD